MRTINWKVLRDIGTILKEFKQDKEQNGGKFDLEEFYEWLREKTWTDEVE